MTELICPLCADANAALFFEDASRSYHRCANCRLIFVPERFHLSRDDEKAEYDLHQNSPDDAGYRQFLARMLNPVTARIQPHSRGLDFGSGPGPTLSVMFEEAGHRMSIYDPFYAPDQIPLACTYDFVTATEVVEHFRNPAAEMQRMRDCVRPGGLLGIMTKLALDKAAFAKWHYRNDRTHVSFYSRETFQWLASEWDATPTFVGYDVVLMSFTDDSPGSTTHAVGN